MRQMVILSLIVALCSGFALQPRAAVVSPPARSGRPQLLESEASIAAKERAANVRTANAEEEKALRVCRIEFAPYPEGKYNKIISDEDKVYPDAAERRRAAFDACRKDLPALASWSNIEIEATYNALERTPSEIFVNSPLGPFFLLSSFCIWRDGLAAWSIPPCKEYLDFCQIIPTIQFRG